MNSLINTSKGNSLDDNFLKMLIDSSPMAVRIAKPGASSLLYSNSVYKSLLGIGSDEDLSKFSPVAAYADKDEFNAILNALDHGIPVTDKIIELTLNDGQSKWVMATYTPSLFDGDPVEIAWFYDVTTSVLEHKSVEELALIDSLTKLPNKISFTSSVNSVLAVSAETRVPVAIGFLDLDGFKEVNDTFGHEAGDLLLKEVSSRIKGALRAGDIVARIGGDEFAILIPKFEDVFECSQIMERVLRVINRPFSINASEVKVSASIGVTIFPVDDGDFDTLMRHADQAMYSAKLKGKNNFVIYDVNFSKKMVEKQRVKDRVSSAISAGEMELYYQPQVSLSSGQVIGVEALIRWNSPEGLVSPIEFLPHIENTPVEAELGEWVIKEGFFQLLDWNNSGLALKVSVNVTSDYLMSPSFIPNLRALVSKTPISIRNMFQLEIVESSAFSNLTGISKVVSQCSELGIKVSLDDFGTGYSSLSHLRYLAVSQVKVDKDFVINMVDSQNDYFTVKGALGLSSTFHHASVAEGVESLDHGSLLVALGCDIAQGYFISKPIPAKFIPAWVSRYKCPQEWLDLRPFKGDFYKAELILLQLKSLKWISKIKDIVNSEEYSFENMEFVDYSSLFFKEWVDSARMGKAPKEYVESVESILESLMSEGLSAIQQTVKGNLNDANKSIQALESINSKLLAI